MEDIFGENYDSEIPLIGAQVFIEPGQTPEEIDTWFHILHENQLPICRIRLFETYMRTPDGGWNFNYFDHAFQAAEKYGIKILGTLFPATPFTDVGGFKFPHTIEHLEEVAVYIEKLVTHFRESPALLGWVLINEPGVGDLPTEEFTREKFRQWLAEQKIPAYDSKGYSHFDFAEERFLLDYNTWYLHWLATEIHKYDPGRYLHVNNHAIFRLVSEYDFPAWRGFLSSLGGSAHASWHFDYFKRNQYAMAMAAECEIIRSGAGALPWLMTEIQGGNNVYSGYAPMCPTSEEISQWLWTIIGSGGKGGIFWCLNPRASGFEAGEWSLIDFHNQPSDRLDAAAMVSQIIQENESLFANAQPIDTPIHILYIRESLWVERTLQRGGIHYEGRETGGVMKSVLGYFETLCEMGLQPQIGEISEFNFSKSDYTGSTLILAHQISVPSRYWRQIEHFVEGGGKLLVDGLTAYYDENAHCVMNTGFPLAEVFGASINEFKLKSNLFDFKLSDPELMLPSHCWEGNLQNQSAKVISSRDGEIKAVRHTFGRGEVVWIPTLLGLGARLADNRGLSTLLYQETDKSIRQVPFRFTRHQPGILSRTLQAEGAYLTILINKQDSAIDLELNLPDSFSPNYQPEVLYSLGEEVTRNQNVFRLAPEETLVLKWVRQ